MLLRFLLAKLIQSVSTGRSFVRLRGTVFVKVDVLHLLRRLWLWLGLLLLLNLIKLVMEGLPVSWRSRYFSDSGRVAEVFIGVDIRAVLLCQSALLRREVEAGTVRVLKIVHRLDELIVFVLNHFPPLSRW